MVHLLYLDPGSGSLLLQAVIAGFLGIGIFFKNLKIYILHLFGKNRKKFGLHISSADNTLKQKQNG
jgi:hypothetical protein